MRHWTLAEATAALPELERLLRDAQAHLAKVRDIEANINDLRIVWGSDLDDPDCPGHDEAMALVIRVQAASVLLRDALREMREFGVEAKGIEDGLVDFRGMVGDQEGYLCWRLGEDRITHWHTLEGGFSGRKPIPDAG